MDRSVLNRKSPWLPETYNELKKDLFIEPINMEAQKRVSWENTVTFRYGSMPFVVYYYDCKTRSKIMFDNLSLMFYNKNKECIIKDAILNNYCKEPIYLDYVPIFKRGNIFSFKMHVLKTKASYNGAKAITFPGCLEQISCKNGGDFYIFPSSVHEMLVLNPNYINNPRIILNIVMDMNKQIRPKDVFTDIVLYYNCKNKYVYIIDDKGGRFPDDDDYIRKFI